MYDVLKQLPVFLGVSTEQLTHILEVIPFEFNRFQSGEVFCKSGDPCQGIYFLVSGKVQVETPIFKRRVKIVQTFHAPYTFSLHHLFGAETHVHSKLSALSEKTGLMYLRKSDFLKLLQENEVTLINTMNILSSRAQQQHKIIDFTGETDPVLKLSSWMLSFTERAAKEVSFEAKEVDWCDMLKLDAPTFWRSVAILEGLHMVESENGRLKLLDRYGLKTIVRNKTVQK